MTQKGRINLWCTVAVVLVGTGMFTEQLVAQANVLRTEQTPTKAKITTDRQSPPEPESTAQDGETTIADNTDSEGLNDSEGATEHLDDSEGMPDNADSSDSAGANTPVGNSDSESIGDTTSDTEADEPDKGSNSPSKPDTAKPTGHNSSNEVSGSNGSSGSSNGHSSSAGVTQSGNTSNGQKRPPKATDADRVSATTGRKTKMTRAAKIANDYFAGGNVEDLQSPDMVRNGEPTASTTDDDDTADWPQAGKTHAKLGWLSGLMGVCALGFWGYWCKRLE